MSSKIGVAIIGSGIFPTDEHLPAVQACNDLELKAIYSRSLKSAQTLSANVPGVDLYSDDSDGKSYSDLLARPDIQAVIIALPIPVQTSFTKQALKAGKHVLAEKPLAKDLSTALELISWCKEQNIDSNKASLSIAENFRFTTVFAKAAEQIQEFGQVKSFNVRVHVFLPPGYKWTTTDWRKKPEYQGGFLLDSGVHLTAVIRRMLGSHARVKRLSAFTASQAEHLPPVDTVASTVQLENGAIGAVSISFGSSFLDGDFSVACEKGTVSANYFTSELWVKPAGGEESVKSLQDGQSNVTYEVNAWTKGILAGKPEAGLSVEEALADLEIVEAMLASNGIPVEMKYQSC